MTAITSDQYVVLIPDDDDVRAFGPFDFEAAEQSIDEGRYGADNASAMIVRIRPVEEGDRA